MRYDLTSLEVFVAVANTGNLTRAAEQQHLAISAISKRISELETLTGSALLERHARGVSLTAAGQSLLHYARQVLQLVDQMHGELCEYAGGLKGVVRLHASTSALVEFLPQELKSLMQCYPGVRIEIEERTGGAIVKAVASGEADLGVLGDHAPIGGLHRYHYHSDRLALAVPASHELASANAVFFRDVLHHDLVGPHADSTLWQLMCQAATEANASLSPRVQVSSFECMCLLVEAGLGVAMLPEKVMQPAVDRGGVVRVDLLDAWSNRQLVIISRQSLEQLPLTTRAVIDHLVAASALGMS